MKKLIALVLALCLAASLTAIAEFDDDLFDIEKVDSTLTADFDGDRDNETVKVSFDVDEYDCGSFTLTVDGQSIKVDGCEMLTKQLYAMRVGYPQTDYCWGTMFMVREDGPSDDPVTHCLLYTNNTLFDVGAIPASCEGFEVDGSGLIYTAVRANMIGTWSRSAIYKLASGYFYTEDGDLEEHYRIVEVPQDIYPMGMIVTLKRDLDLYVSRFSSTIAGTIYADRNVILAASDDASWLYVSDMDGEIKGWVPMTENEYVEMVMVNGEYVYVDEVFGNILYAD